MADAGELKVVVSADISDFQKDMKKVTSEIGNVQKQMSGLQKAGQSLSSIGGSLTKGLTLPLMAVGTAAMVAWKQVDEGLDTIVTKTGATGKALEDLQKSFKKVAQTVPASMQEVGDAIGEVSTQFGFMGEQLEQSTELFIKFSKITGTDVTQSVQMAKGILSQFGMTADEVSTVLDTLTVAGQRTGVSIAELASQLQRFAPQIRALGLNFETATMMLASWTQQGFDAAKMMQYLTLSQTKFAKEGMTLQQGLEALAQELAQAKDEAEALTVATKYFGTRGAAYMLNAIKKGALDLEQFAKAAGDAAGSVTTTFENTLDPVDKFALAMNNLKLIGAELGTALQGALAPALTALVSVLQTVTSWFVALPDGVKQVIAIMGVLAAAIGPVLMIVGKIIQLLPLMGTAFAVLTGPIGLAIGAIAGAIAIGVALYKNWDTIKNSLINIWNAIAKAASTIWNAIVAAIKTPINAIIKLVNKMITALNAIHFSIPDWVPVLGGKSFGFNLATIPTLAKGGIVTKPTLALIGEAGPEVVLPLETTTTFSGPLVVVQNMTVRSEEDIAKISKQLYSFIQTNRRARGFVV
jgi:phage-related minor tail protein